jgi:hypothetical protein
MVRRAQETSCKEVARVSNEKATLPWPMWLRGRDLTPRPLDYENYLALSRPFRSKAIGRVHYHQASLRRPLNLPDMYAPEELLGSNR